MAPGGSASIALARTLSADHINRANNAGANWKMVKQVHFNVSGDQKPTTSKANPKHAAAPSQVYSSTSAPLVESAGGRTPKSSAVRSAATVPAGNALTPTEHFDSMLSVSTTLNPLKKLLASAKRIDSPKSAPLVTSAAERALKASEAVDSIAAKTPPTKHFEAVSYANLVEKKKSRD
jgi:hypothetical protein